MGAPSDVFLWFALFLADSARNDSSAERLPYLRMSYELGTNEGWIAVMRNRLALALYPELPPDLAEAATSEFLGLVRSELYDAAADTIAGPGWPIRDVLLTRLRELSERNRRDFAAVLNRRELEEDVPIPGIDLPPRRPWQH